MDRRFMLFVPMYNCAPQIPRTLAQVTPELAAHLAEVFVLDNGSTDGGPQAAIDAGAAIDAPVVVAQNKVNVGLGGSHKAAFERCLERGYDGVIVFHGDDQGRLADLLPTLPRHPDAECVLGSRFMVGSQLQGYAPHRILANLAFNALFSAMARQVLWDLGSGLNFYTRAFLERRLFDGCADDLTFNYHLILRTAAVPGLPVAFEPISWREDDQISNAKLWKHGVTMLRIVRDHTLHKRAFLTGDHRVYTGPRGYVELSA